MRLNHLSVVLFFGLSAALVACGGDDGGGGVTVPDASIDAAPDAPAALTGLGQACDPAMQGADCPAMYGCLTFTMGATKGLCTKYCVMNGSFMTDAMAKPGALNPDPTTKNGECAAIYTGGSAGVPECNILTRREPTGALEANKTYTFDFVCGIACGAGNTCPGTLTCDTNEMLCVP